MANLRALFSFYNLILVICCASFLAQLVVLWIGYYEGKTAVGITTQEDPFKFLPCLTICPLPAFKDTVSDLSLESSMDDYLASTFGTSEIFSPNTIRGFNDSSRWHVKEIRSLMVGRCTVVCYRLKQEKLNFNSVVRLYLDRKFNYQVYLHEPGDEFWLANSIFPYHITTLRLSASSGDKFKSADLQIKQVDVVAAKKTPQHSCDGSIRQSGFVECIESSLQSHLSNNLHQKCKILTSVYDNLTMGLCKDEECVQHAFAAFTAFKKEAIKGFTEEEIKFYSSMLENSESVGCRLPCTITQYKFSINYFSRKYNTLAHNETSYFEFVYFYNPLSTQVQTEYYIIDLSGVLTNIGGNMGLFLGYSILTLLLALIEALKRLFNRN